MDFLARPAPWRERLWTSRSSGNGRRLERRALAAARLLGVRSNLHQPPAWRPGARGLRLFVRITGFLSWQLGGATPLRLLGKCLALGELLRNRTHHFCLCFLNGICAFSSGWRKVAVFREEEQKG